jgi:hypothetical protein
MGYFLTSWVTISFSRRPLLHVVSCHMPQAHKKCEPKFLHSLFRILSIQQAICKTVLLDFIHHLNYKITSNNRVMMTRMTAENTTAWHELKPQWGSGILHKVVTAQTRRESLTEKYALNTAGPKPKTFVIENLHLIKPPGPLYQKSSEKTEEVYVLIIVIK